MDLPEQLRPLCHAFLEGLQSILAGKLCAVTLYGALTFPETVSTGDIDGHVLLAGPLAVREKDAIHNLHAALARDYPPLGTQLDVYYLLLADAQGTAPPQDQLQPALVDGSWALHCAHIRAGRCIFLFSAPAALERLYPVPTWPALEAALYRELRFIEVHFSEYPAYCVLNLCRLIYSFQTHDVVISKVEAAAWASQALPRWQLVIAAAERFYAGRTTSGDDDLLQADTPALLRFAQLQIAAK